MRLGGYLKKHNPDVICLQESFNTKHRAMIHDALGRETYRSSDTDLSMRRVFLSRMDRTGGLVIFSKYPIKETSFTPFRCPILMSPQERIGRKGFLQVEVETPAGPALVIATHLYSIRSNHATGMRLFQLKQILKATKEKRGQMAAFLTGDLNEHLIMNQTRFRDLLHGENFADSTELTGKPPAPSYRPENPLTRTRFNNGSLPMRLDYVLCTGLNLLNLRAATNDVLAQPEEPISDHDPVMVTLVTGR